MAGREGTRKPVARQSSFRTVAALTLIPLAGFVALLLWQFLAVERERVGAGSPQRQTPRVTARATKAQATPVRHRGKIVVILDDVGFDQQPLEKAMSIDPNISFSILPNAARASEFAERLHARSFEILCHLPMEPLDWRNSPGAGAITTSMSDAEIASTTRRNVGAIRYARGVNNHMGSRATSDPRVMRSVLRSLPEGMFFIDSMTTSGSAGFRLAREMKIPTAVRSVFLDPVATEPAVRQQIRQLAAEAEARGAAIAIGHMYPVTVDVLSEEIPRLRRRGFRIVRASAVVD